MMNYVWGGMMVVSVICGLVTGRMSGVCDAIFTGSSQAVELCLTLLSMLVLWGGLVGVMERSGLSEAFGRCLSPVIRWLYPELKGQQKAMSAIAMNMAANILGLGNSATPLGLKAMEELNRINGGGSRASNSMVTFVVVNSVSLQLIPTSLAVLRSRFGAEKPMDILLPVWFASGLAAILAIVLVRLLNRRDRVIG